MVSTDSLRKLLPRVGRGKTSGKSLDAGVEDITLSPDGAEAEAIFEESDCVRSQRSSLDRAHRPPRRTESVTSPLFNSHSAKPSQRRINSGTSSPLAFSDDEEGEDDVMRHRQSLSYYNLQPLAVKNHSRWSFGMPDYGEDSNGAHSPMSDSSSERNSKNITGAGDEAPVEPWSPPHEESDLERYEPDILEIIPGKRVNTRLKALKESLNGLVPGAGLLQRNSYNPYSELRGDVVVLGGYRGSRLRDVQADKRVWVPMGEALLGPKKHNGVDIGIGLYEEDEDEEERRIHPERMIDHIGPVDMSRRLLRKLRRQEKKGHIRVHEWAYDWRLSSLRSAKKLIAFLESLPCNSRYGNHPLGATVICHSMGGLVTHYAVQTRPELFAGVLYCGTPFSHCINILGPLRHGDVVLNNKSLLRASVNFTFRSSYVFLPENGRCFVDKSGEEEKEIRVNFFDWRTWAYYGLAPSVNMSHRRQDIDNFHCDPNPAVCECHPPLDGERNNFDGPESSESNGTTSTTNVAALAPSNAAAKITGEGFAPEMGGRSSDDDVRAPPCSHILAETVPYLKRTLEETHEFSKVVRSYNPENASRYPPFAILYSKALPTVIGTRVDGERGILEGDFSDYIYARGDGVVTAKSSQMPRGFKPVERVLSDRGHVGLLGDLPGIGKALVALQDARKKHPNERGSIGV
ncbi:hypothetical protein YB2330_005426 [Saitoella coloradoensis]